MHDWAGAAARLHCSEQMIQTYFQQLQECTPFPCAAYESETVSWILPEFEVRIEDEHCVLESMQEVDLELNENPSLELAQALHEARFFLSDAANRRTLTLSLIMNELLQIQEIPLIRGAPEPIPKKDFHLIPDQLPACFPERNVHLQCELQILEESS